MAKCSHCSAPLAANTNKCLYCGTRNDVDLKNRHNYSIVDQESSLLCPHCEKTLQTIDLKIEGSFLIHRCLTCFGLFFDAGKFELLLEKSVDPVFDINLQQLDYINQDRFSTEKEVKYVKCPVCQTFMNRNLFGYRSGVIVDRCQRHGIWFNSGEITHLQEWKKAGGQLLQEQQKLPENQESPKQNRVKPDYISNPDYTGVGVEGELLNTVANLIGKLFE
jgi:Zn-finger nucleic acid-binding protein